MTLKILSRNSGETFDIGRRLGALLGDGDVVALSGPLGAGKTVLAKGVGAGLGVKEEILSPSFNIALEYVGRTRLRHVDFYRLSATKEALDMGMEEYVEGDGVAVIEWADKLADLIPGDRLWIKMDFAGGDERTLELDPRGRRFEIMAEKIVGGR